MKTEFKKIALGLLLVTATSQVYAQMPQTNTQNGVEYVTGGIGLDEVEAIKAESKNWGLQITFTEKVDNRFPWVSDVDLKIEQEKGTEPLLKIVTDGPYVLAKLPSGKYKITASYLGKTLTKTVTINNKATQRISMVW